MATPPPKVAPELNFSPAERASGYGPGGAVRASPGKRRHETPLDHLSVLLSVLGMASHLTTFVLSLLLQGPDRTHFLIDLLLFGTVLLLLSSATSRQKAGVDFLISFFFLFFLAFPGRLQISLNVFPWGGILSDEHVSLAIGLLALSQLCYAVGQTLALSKPVPKPSDSQLTVETAKFYVKWSWGLALFSLICAGVAGPDSLFTPRQARPEGGFAGLTQQFLFMARAVSLLAFVMMIYLARFCPHKGLKRQSLLFLLLFLPIFISIYFPPALSRFALFGGMIAVSCPYLDYQKPAFKIIMIGFSILFLLFVFPIAKIIADGSVTIGQIVDALQSLEILSILVRSDFDAFMQTVSAVQYLDDGYGGIRWGYNFLGAFLFFVPRGIWASKPLDTGGIVSESLGYWYNNVSCPLPAEALMGFGPFGPFIVFGLLGYFIMRIELGAGKASLSQFALYAITMGFIVIIMRGALNGVAAAFASGFLAYAVMMFVRRHKIVWSAP